MHGFAFGLTKSQQWERTSLLKNRCTAARHKTNTQAPASKTSSYKMENTHFTLDVLFSFLSKTLSVVPRRATLTWAPRIQESKRTLVQGNGLEPEQPEMSFRSDYLSAFNDFRVQFLPLALFLSGLSRLLCCVAQLVILPPDLGRAEFLRSPLSSGLMQVLGKAHPDARLSDGILLILNRYGWIAWKDSPNGPAKLKRD